MFSYISPDIVHTSDAGPASGCLSTVQVYPCLAHSYDIFRVGLYRIWCGVNRLVYSGVHTLGDNSAFVNSAG